LWCTNLELSREVSGKPIVNGTRILADAVMVNAARGVAAEERANEHFPGLGVERARRVREAPRPPSRPGILIDQNLFSRLPRSANSATIRPPRRRLEPFPSLALRQYDNHMP
jgi:hypothetical protein